MAVLSRQLPMKPGKMQHENLAAGLPTRLELALRRAQLAQRPVHVGLPLSPGEPPTLDFLLWPAELKDQRALRRSRVSSSSHLLPTHLFRKGSCWTSPPAFHSIDGSELTRGATTAPGAGFQSVQASISCQPASSPCLPTSSPAAHHAIQDPVGAITKTEGVKATCSWNQVLLDQAEPSVHRGRAWGRANETGAVPAGRLGLCFTTCAGADAGGMASTGGRRAQAIVYTEGRIGRAARHWQSGRVGLPLQRQKRGRRDVEKRGRRAWAGLQQVG